MDLSSASPSLPAQPRNMSWDGSQDLSLFPFPTLVKWPITLMIASAAGHSAGFARTSAREMCSELTEKSRPRHHCKAFGGVVQSG